MNAKRRRSLRIAVAAAWLCKLHQAGFLCRLYNTSISNDPPSNQKRESHCGSPVCEVAMDRRTAEDNRRSWTVRAGDSTRKSFTRPRNKFTASEPRDQCFTLK
ncbi:hypothetical protein B7463_g6287, partial [Scytalidium lignicola]